MYYLRFDYKKEKKTKDTLNDNLKLDSLKHASNV